MESFSSRFESPAQKFMNHFREKDLSVEQVDKILRSIEELLFIIVETGGDLDPQIVKQLRARLQALLEQLGLSGVVDLPVIYKFLSGKAQERIAPDWYPELWKFEDKVRQLLRENIHTQEPVPQNVSAADLAQNAQLDPNLQGRGGLNLAEYLYNLGIFMTNAYAYKVMIADSDSIKVDDNWRIENGRHRSFVLRVFGKKNVEDTKIDKWVKVERIKNIKIKISNFFKKN